MAMIIYCFFFNYILSCSYYYNIEYTWNTSGTSITNTVNLNNLKYYFFLFDFIICNMPVILFFLSAISHIVSLNYLPVDFIICIMCSALFEFLIVERITMSLVTSTETNNGCASNKIYLSVTYWNWFSVESNVSSNYKPFYNSIWCRNIKFVLFRFKNLWYSFDEKNLKILHRLNRKSQFVIFPEDSKEKFLPFTRRYATRFYFTFKILHSWLSQ